MKMTDEERRNERWWIAGIRNAPNDFFWLAVGALLMWLYLR